MSNVIASLLVELGVVGESGTKKALETTKVGMGELYSSSLATKAAILAVVYGLEQLMMTSAAMGTNLLNLSAISGDTTKDLQQIGWAAQQSGLSAKDAENAFVGLATRMQGLDFAGTSGGQAVSLMQSVLGNFDVDRAKKDHKYLVDEVQKYYNTAGVTLAQKNATLNDLGLGSLTKAFADKSFNPKNYASAPVLSDATLKNLSAVQTKWLNFETHLENIIAKLTSAHGGQLVGELDKIAVALGHLVGNLDKLAEKMKVFQAIGWLFEISSDALESIADNKTSKGTSDSILNYFTSDEFAKKFFATDPALLPKVVPPDTRNIAVPATSPRAQSKTTHHVDVNISGVIDPKVIVDHHQKTLNEASGQDPNDWAN
jgi:hypothetical protein